MRTNSLFSLRFTSLLPAVLLLAACSSTPVEPEQELTAGGLPNWVASPVVDGGFADTQCVENIAGVSVLRGRAVALARAELARNIDIRVQAMDSTYDRLVEASDGVNTGSTFESVSRQVADEKLSGSRIEHMDFVEFPNGEQMLCVKVVLSPEVTEELYRDVVARSGRQLDPRDEAVLYEEFRAHRAQQAMEAELERQQAR